MSLCVTALTGCEQASENAKIDAIWSDVNAELTGAVDVNGAYNADRLLMATFRMIEMVKDRCAEDRIAAQEAGSSAEEIREAAAFEERCKAEIGRRAGAKQAALKGTSSPASEQPQAAAVRSLPEQTSQTSRRPTLSELAAQAEREGFTVTPAPVLPAAPSGMSAEHKRILAMAERDEAIRCHDRARAYLESQLKELKEREASPPAWFDPERAREERQNAIDEYNSSCQN